MAEIKLTSTSALPRVTSLKEAQAEEKVEEVYHDAKVDGEKEWGEEREDKETDHEDEEETWHKKMQTDKCNAYHGDNDGENKTYLQKIPTTNTLSNDNLGGVDQVFVHNMQNVTTLEKNEVGGIYRNQYIKSHTSIQKNDNSEHEDENVTDNKNGGFNDSSYDEEMDSESTSDDICNELDDTDGKGGIKEENEDRAHKDDGRTNNNCDEDEDENVSDNKNGGFNVSSCDEDVHTDFNGDKSNDDICKNLAEKNGKVDDRGENESRADSDGGKSDNSYDGDEDEDENVTDNKDCFLNDSSYDGDVDTNSNSSNDDTCNELDDMDSNVDVNEENESRADSDGCKSDDNCDRDEVENVIGNKYRGFHDSGYDGDVDTNFDSDSNNDDTCKDLDEMYCNVDNDEEESEGRAYSDGGLKVNDYDHYHHDQGCDGHSYIDSENDD